MFSFKKIFLTFGVLCLAFGMASAQVVAPQFGGDGDGDDSGSFFPREIFAQGYAGAPFPVNSIVRVPLING